MIPGALLRYAGLERKSLSPGSTITSRFGIGRLGKLNEVEGSAEHVAERLAAKRD